MWRGRGGRGEEIVSSKVITGMSQAVCLPHCRRGACDFHGRLRRGGGGERGAPGRASAGFYCFKIHSQPEGCEAKGCSPSAAPSPSPSAPCTPLGRRRGERERLPGGSRGWYPAGMRRGRGCGGDAPAGFSRELKRLLGRGDRQWCV